MNAFTGAAALASSRTGSVLWLSALGTFYLFFLAHAYVGYYNDDAYYILGARSLLDGAFRHIHRLGQPPILEFWPGYPSVLLPFVALFPRNLWILQLTSLLFLVGSAALTSRFYEKRLGNPSAFLFVALVFLSPHVAVWAGSVMAEPAYLFVSLLGLRLYGKWAAGEDPSAGRGLLLGSLMGFSAFLRPFGLALISAVALDAFARGRRRGFCLLSGPPAVMLAAWIGRNAVLTAGAESPLHQASEWTWVLAAAEGGIPSALVRNILRNAWYYFQWTPDALLPVHWLVRGNDLALIRHAWRALFFCVSFSGAWRLFRRPEERAWPLYAALYCVILLAWIHPDVRYLLPLLPVVALFFAEGTQAWALRVPRARLLAAAALGVTGFADIALARKLAQDNRYNVPPRETYRWIGDNVGVSDRILCSMAGRVYLYTDRSAEEFPLLGREQDVFGFMRERGITHVLVTDEDFIPSVGPNPWDVARARVLSSLRNDGRVPKLYENRREGTVVLGAYPAMGPKARVP